MFCLCIGNSVEWNGAWCDKSREWNTVDANIKKELELVKADDGEYICF